jgi:NADH:ubiquinone oxidoreductase subunit E
MTTNGKVGSVLVVGGGIAGMQSALDLADSGLKVYLVDDKPCIGGVMSQLDKTFPTNDCAMCTMAPRLVQIGRHKDIEIITLADVQSITGEPGNFTVTLNKRPRFVREDKCTGCGTCTANCPVRNQIYLYPEEKVEIKLELADWKKMGEIIEKYRDHKGALVPILQEINATFNYLPENALRYVSEELDIPVSLIYRLATFYNAFSLKPKGKNTIQVCMGTACYVKGGEKILREFERELDIEVGGVTGDLKFGLETVNCIGCCGQAPGVAVGEDIYGYMKPTLVPEVQERYK